MSLRFEKITIDMFDKVETLRSRSAHRLYSHAFSTIFTWRESMMTSICLSDEVYLVKDGERGDNAYFFPCGSTQAKIDVINALVDEVKNPVFYYVREEDVAFLEEHFPDRFSVAECRDDFSYIYDKAEQIGLAGGKFKHTRRRIAEFQGVSFTAEKITPQNIDRAVAISEKWLKMPNHVGAIDHEETVNALQNLEKLRLFGYIFNDGEKDCGYILGYFIAPDTFDMQICKTTESDVEAVIRHEFYKLLPQEITLIDMEDDLGIAGLRQSKLSKNPVFIMPSYSATLRST